MFGKKKCNSYSSALRSLLPNVEIIRYTVFLIYYKEFVQESNYTGRAHKSYLKFKQHCLFLIH